MNNLAKYNIIYSGGIGGPVNINNNIIYNIPAVNANIIYNNKNTNWAIYNNIPVNNIPANNILNLKNNSAKYNIIGGCQYINKINLKNWANINNKLYGLGQYIKFKNTNWAIYNIILNLKNWANIILNLKNNSAKYNNINTRNNKVSDYIIRIRPIYNKKINNLINNPAIKYIKYSGIIRIGLNTIKNINNKIIGIGLKAINNIKGIRPIKIPANINNKLYRLGQYIKFKNN